MRLLYLSRAYTCHDRRFLEAFREAGMDVCCLFWEDRPLEKRPLPDGVTPLGWPGRTAAGWPAVMGRALALRSVLRDCQVDLGIAGPIQSCALTAALAGLRPLVAMAWGSDILVDADRNWRMWLMTRHALRRAAGAICDCRAAEEALSRHSGGILHAGNTLCIPWGIDTRLFTPDTGASRVGDRLGWPRGQVLISSRSWEPIYCVDTLVRAFALVRGTHPDARLILLGGGSQERLIGDLIRELGLEALVHRPGRIGNTQTVDCFRSSDLYVSTALSDGTSISMLEAMGCGLPVIVSEGYGNVEWVRPGVHGWLVRPRDPGALAAAIGEALDDAQVRRGMASANRRLVCEKADWSVNKGRLTKFIEGVLSRSRKA